MAIDVGPQPSQGIGGIPTKYVVIGAGVLGLGALLLMQKRAPAAAPADANFQPTGSTSAQLSSVQQMQLQQFGELTKMFANQSDLIGTQVGGLSAHLDTQAAALSSGADAHFQAVADALGRQSAGESAQFQALGAGGANVSQLLFGILNSIGNTPGMANPWVHQPENVAVGGA